MHTPSAPDATTAAATCLATFEPSGDTSRSALAHARTYLERHGDAALGRTLPEHLTASALVLDPHGERTLLCHHRKGDFWVQPGGHLDPEDTDPLAGALRELREETGLRRYLAHRTVPVDIDRHSLGDGFGRCTWHIDLGFLVVANPDDALAVSDESSDVAWFPLDALPPGCVPGLAARLALPRSLVRGDDRA